MHRRWGSNVPTAARPFLGELASIESGPASPRESRGAGRSSYHYERISKDMSYVISSLIRGTAPRSEGSYGKVCGATAMN